MSVSPTAPAASSPVKPAAEPLRVGVLLPYTGVYASLSEEMTNALTLYVEQLGGTVAGRKVEIVKEDDEGKPDVGLRKVRRLIEEVKVDAITGIVHSPVALGVRDYVHGARVPLVISNAGAVDITRGRKSPFIFRTSFSNWQTSHPMGEWVYRNVGKKAYVSAPDYAAGHEMADAFKDGFTKAGGTIAGEVYPPLSNPDFATYLGQMQQARPEVIFCFYAGADALRFVQQYDEFGLKKSIPLTGPGFLVEVDVLAKQGKSAIGIKNLMHYAPALDNPENKKFVVDYTARFNAEPGVYAVQSWDAAFMIAEAVKAVDGNTADRDRFAKAFGAVKFRSPRGPIELDPETNNVVQPQYIRDVRDTNGKLGYTILDRIDRVKDPGK